MTMPNERTRALHQLGERVSKLGRFLHSSKADILRIPRGEVEVLIRTLRHYPNLYDTNVVAAKCPDTFCGMVRDENDNYVESKSAAHSQSYQQLCEEIKQNLAGYTFDLFVTNRSLCGEVLGGRISAEDPSDSETFPFEQFGEHQTLDQAVSKLQTRLAKSNPFKTRPPAQITS